MLVPVHGLCFATAWQLFVRVLFFSVLWLTAIFQKKRLTPDSSHRELGAVLKDPVHGACFATAWATVCASAAFLLSAVVDSYFPEEKTCSRLLSRELGTVSRKSVHGAFLRYCLGNCLCYVLLFFSVLWLTAIFQKKRLAPDSSQGSWARSQGSPYTAFSSLLLGQLFVLRAAFLLSAVADSYFPEEKTCSRLLRESSG